jgi:hypothetical protein
MRTRTYPGLGAPRGASGCIALQRMQDAGLGPLNWLAPVYRDCVGAAGADFADFVASRIARDHRTQHRLLRCRTAEDMQAVQSAFLSEAAADYNASTGERVRIVTDGPAARERRVGH